jgi:hypothetical protein
MGTRTHVTLFDASSVEPLDGAIAALGADYACRRPAISDVNRDAIESRLKLLIAARDLLLEPAPEQ